MSSSPKLARMRPSRWFAARTKRRGRWPPRQQPTAREIAGMARSQSFSPPSTPVTLTIGCAPLSASPPARTARRDRLLTVPRGRFERPDLPLLRRGVKLARSLTPACSRARFDGVGLFFPKPSCGAGYQRRSAGGLRPAVPRSCPLVSTAVDGDCHSLGQSVACACADALLAWHARSTHYEDDRGSPALSDSLLLPCLHGSSSR